MENKNPSDKTAKERYENERQSLEQDILEPQSKAAGAGGNQASGYRGGLQKEPSQQNAKNKPGDENKHVQPNDDPNDVSDEQHGGGMGTRLTGVRIDGFSKDDKPRKD